MLFEPGLPGLSGGQAVPVEERVEACLLELCPERLRRGRVRRRIAQKDVVFIAAHRATIHTWDGLSRFAAWQENKKPPQCLRSRRAAPQRVETAHGAIDAFSQRPLSCASHSFIGPILREKRVDLTRSPRRRRAVANLRTAVVHCVASTVATPI